MWYCFSSLYFSLLFCSPDVPSSLSLSDEHGHAARDGGTCSLAPTEEEGIIGHYGKMWNGRIPMKQLVVQVENPFLLPATDIKNYCCPIKLVSFHRYVLGYRSVDSRVPFFISKPLYPNNNSCSMNLCSVLASISSQSFSGKLNRL